VLSSVYNVRECAKEIAIFAGVIGSEKQRAQNGGLRHGCLVLFFLSCCLYSCTIPLYAVQFSIYLFQRPLLCGYAMRCFMCELPFQVKGHGVDRLIWKWREQGAGALSPTAPDSISRWRKVWFVLPCQQALFVKCNVFGLPSCINKQTCRTACMQRLWTSSMRMEPGL
jgi:hypothetical protein